MYVYGMHFHRHRLLAALWALVLCAPLALAEMQAEHFAIAIELEDGGHSLRLDQLDFDPFSLREGESRSAVDTDGQSLLFTRREGKLVVTTAGGKEITLPLVEQHGRHVTWASAGEAPGNFDIELRHAALPEGLLIISGQSLDEATREKVRGALVSAGIEQPVSFAGHGAGQVMMIERCGDAVVIEKRVTQEREITAGSGQ